MPASQRRWSILAVAAFAVAALAPSGPGRAQSYEAQLEVRVSTLEQQISQLTGQIEQLQYQNQQLADQLKRAQADIEFRLNELEGGGGGAKAAPAPAPAPAKRAPAQGSAPAAPRTPQPFTPTPLMPPKRSDAAPLPPVYDGQGDSLGGMIQDMGAADPGAAASGFASTEPQSYGLAAAPGGNATDAYSLGESLLAQGRPGEAANAFNTAWSMDPRGPQAPGALMRMAQSLLAARQDRSACDAFARLVADYPDAPPQMLRRAKDQQLLLRC